MDAHTSYILSLSEAHLGELRRHAAEYALSRQAKGGRRSWRSRARERYLDRRWPAPEPVALPSLRADSPEGGRRSAA